MNELKEIEDIVWEIMLNNIDIDKIKLTELIAKALLAWHEKKIEPIREVYKEHKGFQNMPLVVDENCPDKRFYLMPMTKLQNKMWKAIRKVVEEET